MTQFTMPLCFNIKHIETDMFLQGVNAKTSIASNIFIVTTYSLNLQSSTEILLQLSPKLRLVSTDTLQEDLPYS